MIIEAILLGLSTGSYCLFSCAPIVTPMFLSVEPELRQSKNMVFNFLFGRLSGYIFFGIILGMTGGYINSSLSDTSLNLFKGIVSMIVGSLLLMSGLKFQFPKLNICKVIGRFVSPVKGSYIFGLLTGVNVCPPFLGAATRVMSKGGVINGIIFFSIFFVFTSLYFLPYLGVPFLIKKIEPLQEIARISMLLIGFYISLFSGLLEIFKIIF